MARIPASAAANWPQFKVNRPGSMEIISQYLYDSASYIGAGQTSLIFFQVPIGQSAKTLADTNMETAGSMPQPKVFLCDTIELLFFPSYGVATAVSQGPVADAPANFWNDVYSFATHGWLDFFIGSKFYLRDGPLAKFPPRQRLGGAAALTSTMTAGAATATHIDYASVAGMAYDITPVALEPNQNFNITLNWPVAVALPSTVAARIVVSLGGQLIRNSQ